MPSFAITWIEQQVLFKKYIRLGNTRDEANNKIHSFINTQKELKQKLLRNKKLKEEDINNKLKKNFEKLCQELDR